MGLRGPRPMPEEKKREALGLLNGEAQVWANLLFELRKGRDGYCGVIRWGPEEKREGMGTFHRGQILGAEQIPKDDLAILPKGMRTRALREYQRKEEGWQYIPPISPQPETWEALKKACTVRQGRRVARDFGRWISRSRNGYVIVQGRKLKLERSKVYRNYWRVLHDHAEEILAAKQLWTYPKSDWADDKRIEFFAKSLAGLMLGLAPATAQRRLTGWRWPVKDFEETRKKFFERMKYQAERRKGAKQ